MNPERWKQIKKLYESALELEPGLREEYLERACPGDESLLNEVRSLLAQQSGDLLDAPALDAAASALAEEKAAEPQQDLLGHTVLHYRFEAKIGEGGMGVVYKAQDIHLNRPVAIKVLPDVLAEDAERLARFEREARLLASLSHPNIAPIHGLEKVEGRPFLVLELVEGLTLEERLKNGPIPVDETLEICRQIAEGLEAAHDKGIIHRDLKPGNIKLTAEGHVKILDFGLAKALHDPADLADLSAQNVDSVTASGVILGTAAYMSPEQARGRTVDKKTDIWALGCVLYECLTARKAFEGETLTETVAAILRDEPEWNALPKSTPSKVVDLLRRCLRKDPKERLRDIGDARLEIEEASPGRAAPAGLSLKRRKTKRWTLAAVATALILSLAGYWGWDFIRTRGSRPELRVVPLTSYPGNESSPSFSPEGREVVFAWRGTAGGPAHIYRKLIGSDARPLQLTSDPRGGFRPAWSPDGKSIAFMRAEDDPRKRNIMTMPALGGPERKLTECTALQAYSFPPWLAWTPDSRFLAIVDTETGDIPYALFLVSIETGERRRLTSPEASEGYGDSGVSFSPDGSNLTFVRSTGHYTWDLFALSLSKDYTPRGEPRRLTFRNQFNLSGAAWTSGGREIVFVSGRRGAAWQVWRMDISGRKPPEPIPLPHTLVTFLAISPQGDRLAYQTGGIDDTNIWMLDLPQRNREAGRPIIASSYLDNDPHFSPDGRRIVFQSDRTGPGSEIWVADADGSNLRQLTRFEAQSGAPCWSPDGTRIVFDSTVHGNRDIFVVDADGGKPKPLTTDPTEEALPRWSNDGKWIYFCSLRSGEYQVWKMSASGGEAVQVTRKRGQTAFESKDGAWLYYTKRELDTSLWRVPAAGGEEVQIAGSVVHWNSFAVEAEGIYYVSGAFQADSGAVSRPPYLIQFHHFADGATQTVASLEEYLQGLSISPDRRTLLYTRLASTGSDLMLVENFR